MAQSPGSDAQQSLPRDAWCGDQPPAMSPSAASRPTTARRLDERDRPALAALLERDPGNGLFLAGNLATFGLEGGVSRFWGAFSGGRLAGALMMVGRRATVYAPPGAGIESLALVAASERFNFTMGRADLVAALLAPFPPVALERREEHYLAELADPRAPALVAPRPSGVTIRRATPADLADLTELYLGSDGFEDLTAEEVWRAMSGRVRGPLRTWVAEVGGRLYAGASTSAEAPGAAMIGGVWTAPAARNRGLSTAVVAALSRELLAESRRAFLFYLMDNVPAARVYAHCGFRVAGRWTVAYLRHGVSA